MVEYTMEELTELKGLMGRDSIERTIATSIEISRDPNEARATIMGVVPVRENMEWFTVRYDQLIHAIYEAPLEELPLHLSGNCGYIAKWRLKLGK